MRYLALLLLLTACGSLRQDSAPAPINMGQKRIETIICNNHQVGENGCVFPEGNVDSTLKIYKVNSGSLEILGCGIDQTFVYSEKGGEWQDIPLPAKIANDCVITILQRVTWKGSEKVPFPIEASIGTVTLGTCPKNVICDISFEQLPLSRKVKPLLISRESSGTYALSGCGQELVPPTAFYNEDFSVDLEKYMLNKKGTGCMFIMGVIGDSGAYYKTYKKAWKYSDEARDLEVPSIDARKKKVCFSGDSESMVVSINGKLQTKIKDCFKPKSSGDFLRFYTSKGRTIIVFVKGGEIVWSK